MNNLNKVSVIIPCRDEERCISHCLDSVIAQDYPKDKIEVLVVDGMSEDGTRGVVKKYIEKHPFIKLLENPKKFTNFAFNIGVRESMGEIIMIMGAHASYEKNYISECVKCLKEYNADNVGGAIKTLPREKTLIAKAISVCLSHSFGVGSSYFRKGSDKPRWVDTVFGGCYKREVFQKIGLFNENLIRSQDMEFNLRLKRAGGKILLVPDIIAHYYPRTSLKKFRQQCFVDGIWSIYPLKFGVTLKFRHFAPLISLLGLLAIGILSFFIEKFVFIFLGLLIFYCLVSLFFSFLISIREKNIKLLFPLPVAFACRHFVYGFGSLVGLSKVILNK